MHLSRDFGTHGPARLDVRTSTPAFAFARDDYARSILEDYHHNLPDSLIDSNGVNQTIPRSHALPKSKPRKPSKKIRIGIIGAGAAGLFAALTLDKIITEQKLNIEYEILEAEAKASSPPTPEDHPIGGRLWTYNFPAIKNGDKPGPNDYYDRGAMRFPETPFQKSFFDLVDYVGIRPKLIPYFFTRPYNLNLFNGRLLTNAQVQSKQQGPHPDFDPYRTGVKGLTGSPDNMQVDQMTAQRKAIASAGSWVDKQGWEALVGKEGVDQWSTRGFVTQVGTPEAGKYSAEVANYLETFNAGTGWYNLAFSEMILESMEFGFGPEIKWHSVQGGSEGLAKAMAKKLKLGKIINGARVTKIAPLVPGDLSKGLRAFYTNPRSRKGANLHADYDHVINTTPFGPFRNIDVSELKFSWGLATAIRTLNYGASTKVGIRFKTRWWETVSHQYGGVSSTDRPSRKIVYPAYGVNETEGASMIVSYTWMQDGLRMGALARGPKGGDGDEVLMRVLLEDLAAVHGLKYEFLRDQVVDHDAWSWDAQPNAGGAFAFFEPGQFRDLYPRVTTPFGGVLHFAGEATSVYHAWVLGSINSAFRTLVEIGIYEGLEEKLIVPMQKMWPHVREFDISRIGKQVWLGRHGIHHR